MNCRLRLAFSSLAFVAILSPTLQGALFSEDFNDGQAATRWSVVSQQEFRTTPPTNYPPDGAVGFAFDYSTLGLANPQGGADTTGAYIRVNQTDQVGNEGEAYGIFPIGKSFTGRFFVEMDMIVYNEQTTSGATEYGMAGVFLDNANPVAPYQLGSAGGPLAWKYSGDGWTTTDLAVFREGTPASTGYVSLGSYDSIPQNSIPGFQTGVLSSRGPAPSGATAKGSWVKVRIESTDSTVRWFLNGTLIDTYDNSAGHYTSGNILIGASDPFNSVSHQATGVIVDNVIVGVPEPMGMAPALLAQLSLWVCMRTFRLRRR
jgi:hypothetical protein